MEKLEHYRDIVQRVLTAVADIPYSNPAIVHTHSIRHGK